MNFNKSLNNLKDELSNLLKMMLVSERINSQRCLNQDLDTTKTIIEHKETSEEFTEEEVDNLLKEAKRLLDMMLVSERINSQRCLNQDLDTTKTIIEHKETSEEFTEEEVDNLLKEAKRLLDMMLVSERINSQRCLNQDLDTTKTIIEHVEKIENDKHHLKLEDKKLELDKVINQIKGILNEMLILERINSQRCLNQDLDTSKTIIDHKE